MEVKTKRMRQTICKSMTSNQFVLYCLLGFVLFINFFSPFLTSKQCQVVEATQSFFLIAKNNSTWNEETKTSI